MLQFSENRNWSENWIKFNRVELSCRNESKHFSLNQEASEQPYLPVPQQAKVEPKKFVKIGRPGYKVSYPVQRFIPISVFYEYFEIVNFKLNRHEGWKRLETRERAGFKIQILNSEVERKGEN